ncbi:MAG TPA: glutamine-hydrolyzing carbamoyl-phosphate synthase small subunit, partial [Myxococcales bacterium]|nr:glutamine-hydrolyzing carbamoyl-phosphate synthase small subunit [Myxococcales bacterium]
MTAKKATLALACGEVFEGTAVGAIGETVGEVVFNTAHTGYQEVLTDPSYVGQLVTFTVSEVGNYGIHLGDEQAPTPQAAGLIARRVCKEPSNWRSQQSLPQFLEQNGVVGIEGVDTRKLVRILRTTGAQQGVVDSTGASAQALVDRARKAPGMEGQDLATRVSTKAPYRWEEGVPGREPQPKTHEVVVVDYGVKRGILRQLVDVGCGVTVVPSRTSAAEILKRSPDGVVLSNGPGDPAAVVGADVQARELLGKVPLLGICLGNQILALAMGGKTYKLKFGHRGANHPVRDVIGDKIDLTSQNHGFAVDPRSLEGKVQVTHVNLYDGTVEGIAAPELKMFAVQYHP